MIDSNVSFETIWIKIATNLKELITPQQFKTWFKSMRLSSYKENNFTFSVPNEFLRDWIASYYLDTLLKAIYRALGDSVEASVAIETDPSLNKKPSKPENRIQKIEPNQNPTPAAPAAPATIGQKKETPETACLQKAHDFYLNPTYVFKDFITGPCNQLSKAACLAVSDNLSSAYNPLFIHGGSGLGKTHLLQAICHKLIQKNGSEKILFLSCETFINHFISAVEKGNVNQFRYKYRYIDLLLIDDIQLLANKERTQEEFFHTFNALYNSGKQIVLSSDSPPSEIPTLQERLVSRFKWGLVTEVYVPDYETRCAILKKKARLKNVKVPHDVIAFLGEHISTNIRELEGAITKVIGYATLMNKTLDIDMAYEAMKDVIKQETKLIRIDQVVKAITQKFSVKLADLQSKKRSQAIALPRQAAMYLIKNLTQHSLQEIGAYFGGRDHTTVLHAHNKIMDKMEMDDAFKSLIENLVMDIKNKA